MHCWVIESQSPQDLAGSGKLQPDMDKSCNDGWLITPPSNNAGILAVGSNVRTMSKDEISRRVTTRIFWEPGKA